MVSRRAFNMDNQEASPRWAGLLVDNRYVLLFPGLPGSTTLPIIRPHRESCERVLAYCCARLGVPEELRPTLEILEMSDFWFYDRENNRMLVRDFSDLNNDADASSATFPGVSEVVAHETFHASRNLGLRIQ